MLQHYRYNRYILSGIDPLICFRRRVTDDGSAEHVYESGNGRGGAYRKGGGRRMKAVTSATYSNTGPERRKVRIEMRKKAEK